MVQQTHLLIIVALIVSFVYVECQTTPTCDCGSYEPNYELSIATNSSSANATICPALDVDYFLIGRLENSFYMTLNLKVIIFTIFLV